MVNFILEEAKLVFIQDIELLETLDTNRLLVRALKANNVFIVRKTNILNADYTQYRNCQ